LTLASCGGAAATQTQAPAQAPPSLQIAQQVIDSSAPSSPLRVIFSWSYKDESMHFSGRGALRVQAPYKARTDLFGPRGETLMRSVVIGDQIFVPPGLPEGLMPPVSLGWAEMGTLRKPEGAQLELTRSNGDTLTIGYVRGDEHWRFRLVGGRMRYAEWTGPGQGKRTVELTGTSSHGLPAQAIYRDWAAFRELITKVEEVHESAAFPPDTWDINSGS
jgi:hypothetical protein